MTEFGSSGAALRVGRLRDEYQDLHHEVLERCLAGESEFGPAIQRLMVREVEIVDELRRYGITPHGESVR